MIITAWSWHDAHRAGDKSSSTAMPPFGRRGLETGQAGSNQLRQIDGTGGGGFWAEDRRLASCSIALISRESISQRAAICSITRHRGGRRFAAISAQQKLGVGVDGRERGLQLVGRAEHVLGPLFGGGHQPPVDGGQLLFALPQGVGQPRRQVPHRPGNEHHRDRSARPAIASGMPARSERQRACQHAIADGSTPGDLQQPGRPGTSPWPKASPARLCAYGKEDARQDDVEQVHERREGLQAAQVVNHHREHRQVQEDLQPEAAHEPIARAAGCARPCGPSRGRPG